MATPVVNREFDVIEVLVSEIASGVDRAVDHWMLRIDHALNDDSLTSLGRLNAVKEIMQHYHYMKGKNPRPVKAAV